MNVINFGGMLYAWITVANAARVGTQYYITGPATVGAPTRPSESAVQALVINDLKALPNTLASQVCVSTSLSGTVHCNTGSAPTGAPPRRPNRRRNASDHICRRRGQRQLYVSAVHSAVGLHEVEHPCHSAADCDSSPGRNEDSAMRLGRRRSACRAAPRLSSLRSSRFFCSW